MQVVRTEDPWANGADYLGVFEDWDPCIDLFDEWLHRFYYGCANGHRWSAPQLKELFSAERDKWQRLAAYDFLEMLRPGGPWVLTAIPPDGETTTDTMHTSAEVETFIRKHDGTKNLYYSVNPTRTTVIKKAAAPPTACARRLAAGSRRPDARPTSSPRSVGTQVERYTKAADQERMARQGMAAISALYQKKSPAKG